MFSMLNNNFISLEHSYASCSKSENDNLIALDHNYALHKLGSDNTSGTRIITSDTATNLNINNKNKRKIDCIISSCASNKMHKVIDNMTSISVPKCTLTESKSECNSNKHVILKSISTPLLFQ